MSEYFFNPWVIIIITVSIIVGNISLLKYTAHMKFPKKKNDKKTEKQKK